MTLYKPYLIYIAISLISFIGSFVIRKLIIKERIPANDKYIKRIGIPICIYFLVKLFFGWRLNWFTETTILLILFVCFDYFIIIKNKYSSNTQWIYYLIRYCSFGLPFVSFIVLYFMIVISLGYGALATCKFFPTDRSSIEMNVMASLLKRNFYSLRKMSLIYQLTKYIIKEYKIIVVLQDTFIAHQK